ncbi:MAG: 50S ribosomal protein L24 [Candidatus Omnitrophica bacterium]|nr:50S ribosomal protein L24 [Candidatus Omnitrophota bacterium]
MRIRKGDKVLVLAGKDKGKSGKVLHVYPKKGRALVEGINFVKKHMRKSQQHPQGALLSQEATIHLSNLGLIDPASGKFSRIRALVADDGSKQRISAKSKAVIESHER